jgi:hypothetical protein
MNSRKNKLLLWSSIGIVLFMFLPIIIAFSYQFIMSLKGITVHEGNSGIFSLLWYSLITIPIGLIAFLILGIGILINKYQKKKYRDKN